MSCVQREFGTGWRSDRLRNQSYRRLPSGRRLHRPALEGAKPGDPRLAPPISRTILPQNCLFDEFRPIYDIAHERKGRVVLLKPTPEAIRMFNQSRARRIGLFHVTC
jgi:hypothetical protein